MNTDKKIKILELINDIEEKLDEADKQAEQTEKRYTHDEMFAKIKALL